MNVIRLQSDYSTWANTVDQLYHALGGAGNLHHFPYHFLQTTLPRIGGDIVLFYQAAKLVGVGLLFPRFDHEPATSQQLAYTLRLHRLPGAEELDFTQGSRQLAQQLADATISLYEPDARHTFHPTHLVNGAVDIGRPAAHEAAAIRTLQQQVWGSAPGYLYPADMHSVEFGLGTSLVARVEGQPVGFLFGFDKIGADPLPADWQQRFQGQRRIESQTLGVLPAYRGAQLGFLLKRQQAQLALQRGIQVINWTVDPLQWPNAQLNFGQLRAIAFDFMPDYYAFRNELNRLPASRFGITWLINTPRVAAALSLEPNSVAAPSAARNAPTRLDLRQERAIVYINQGWQQVAEAAQAARIAIEIPANWTALQKDNLAEAEQWRTTTDRIFQRYIGTKPGQYVVTGIGQLDEKRYLIGEQVDAHLWTRLVHSPIKTDS